MLLALLAFILFVVSLCNAQQTTVCSSVCTASSYPGDLVVTNTGTLEVDQDRPVSVVGMATLSGTLRLTTRRAQNPFVALRAAVVVGNFSTVMVVAACDPSTVIATFGNPPGVVVYTATEVTGPINMSSNCTAAVPALIVGIIIAVVVGVILLILGACVFARWWRRKHQQGPASQRKGDYVNIN